MILTTVLDTTLGRAEIDILIPAHNEASRITRCLQNLATQGFQNINVLILDNHSQDGTATIAQQALAETSLRARLIQTSTKLSLAQVLDTLFAQSTAPFVKYLFADDMLGPDVLAALHRPLAEDPSNVLSYVPRRYFNQTGPCSGPTISARVRALFPKTDDATALVYIGNHIGEPTATMLRSDTIHRLGLCFDSELRQLLDVDFWIQLCLEGRAVQMPDHYVLISCERAGETEANIKANRIVVENLTLRRRYHSQLESRLSLPVRLTAQVYLTYRLIRNLTLRITNRRTP